MYILKWKCRYNCFKRYKVQSTRFDIRKIKESAKNGESSEDEIIRDELDRILQENEVEIKRRVSFQSPDLPPSLEELQDEALAIADSHHKAALNAEGESDQDYDFREFQPATVEEHEDKVYYSNRKSNRITPCAADLRITVLKDPIDLEKAMAEFNIEDVDDQEIKVKVESQELNPEQQQEEDDAEIQDQSRNFNFDKRASTLDQVNDGSGIANPGLEQRMPLPVNYRNVFR